MPNTVKAAAVAVLGGKFLTICTDFIDFIANQCML